MDNNMNRASKLCVESLSIDALARLACELRETHPDIADEAARRLRIAMGLPTEEPSLSLAVQLEMIQDLLAAQRHDTQLRIILNEEECFVEVYDTRSLVSTYLDIVNGPLLPKVREALQVAAANREERIREEWNDPDHVCVDTSVVADPDCDMGEAKCKG